MNWEEGDKRSWDNPWRHPNKEKEEEMRLWAILVFGLIGASVTTFAVTQLRSTIGWIYSQLSRFQSSLKNGRSFRTSFQEESYRMREEYEAKMERVEEQIRRMRSVVNRERNKFRRPYDSWQEYDPGAYHQHFQRDDWYWKEDASFRDPTSNYRETPSTSAIAPLSHHYSVLGLSRLRTIPYTDDEIMSAFRAKAREFHPDQNQDNKDFAGAKFKEVMASYEAIKSERKNNWDQ